MKHYGFKNQEEVLDFLKENPIVKFVKVIFPDVLGREMNFTLPSEELKSAFERGKGFDGSSVEGFARVEESDLIIVPDPKTFRVFPWQYEAQGTNWKEAAVFGDIFDPRGERFKGDSRYILKKTLKESRNLGELRVGPEIEFFIFPDSNNPQLLDHGSYFHGGRWGEVRKAAQIHLRKIGIKADYDHHEAAPSQHEIDLKFTDALSIADFIMLSKYVIKRVARKMGLFASFMPKPITDINGSGMHLHLSLWKDKDNLFFQDKRNPLSNLAKKYIMGLITHGKEIQLVLNQWVNSYKRLIPGYEAPRYLAWGTKNRSAYVRIPETHLKKARIATRFEIRSPDPACNIYLALAVIQAAGLQGVKENSDLFSSQEGNIFEMTKEERRERGIETLSHNLKEALIEFKQSKLIRRTLGEHIFQKIIQNKEIEWKRYRKEVKKGWEKKVSPYETTEYLPVL